MSTKASSDLLVSLYGKLRHICAHGVQGWPQALESILEGKPGVLSSSTTTPWGHQPEDVSGQTALCHPSGLVWTMYPQGIC